MYVGVITRRWHCCTKHNASQAVGFIMNCSTRILWCVQVARHEVAKLGARAHGGTDTYVQIGQGCNLVNTK